MAQNSFNIHEFQQVYITYYRNMTEVNQLYDIVSNVTFVSKINKIFSPFP